MQCIQVNQLGGPEVLTLQEIPDPIAGPGQVVVSLRAVGVNPVDTYIRSGIYGQRPLPYVPGSDAAGTVTGLGSGVSEWKLGDPVYLSGSLSGTYAQQALCHQDQLNRLPKGIDFQQGAALYVPYSTAYRALFQRGQAQPGEWVLIHGASGGVGLAAVQWGRAWGLRVIGTAGTPQGLEQVLRQGASHALNHRTPNYLEEVRQITGGEGPSLILEMLANVNLQRDLAVLARFGRVVVIGNRGSLDFNPRALMTQEADIRGMSLFNTPPDPMQQIRRAMEAGLEAGFLRPVIGRDFPLAEAAQAHMAVMEPGAMGKIILLP
jgi:NADPH2:quinone reductase